MIKDFTNSIHELADALARLRSGSKITVKVEPSSASAQADKELANAIRRGQHPELVEAMREALKKR